MPAFRLLTLKLKLLAVKLKSLAVKLKFLPAAFFFLSAVLFFPPTVLFFLLPALFFPPPSLIFPEALFPPFLPPFLHKLPVTAFRVGFRLLLLAAAGAVVEVAGQQLRHPYDGEHYGGVGASLHIH